MTPESLPQRPPETPPETEPGTSRPPREAPPTDNRTVLTHVVYGLYALTFLTGFTALVGVVMAYFNREPARGTWLESHVSWQIRTFWYGLLLQAIGWVTVWVLIGWFILAAATLWFVWRIAKGWIRLGHGVPIEDPYGFL